MLGFVSVLLLHAYDLCLPPGTGLVRKIFHNRLVIQLTKQSVWNN